MEFTTTRNNIHFSLENIDADLSAHINDPDLLYEYAKKDVRKYGLHSPELTIEQNLQTLAHLQETITTIPHMYVVISPSYDRWDNRKEKQNIFDILFRDEIVYNDAEPEVVLAFFAGIKWSSKIHA